MHPHPAGPAVLGALALLGSSALPSVALARTVTMPETQPVVSFEVPDDWTVTPVGTGLELRAPDRTSVIETGVVKSAKDEIVAWQKTATQRMKAFGVSFDPKANPSHAGGKTGAADPGHVVGPSRYGPGLSASELPSWSMAPPLAFADAPPSGAAAHPRGRTADKPSADEAKHAEAKPAEGKAAEAKPAEAKPAEAKPVETKPVEAAKQARFRTVVLYGAVLDGKAVDVQFLDFSAGGASAFVMQQESNPTDDRAAAIIKSVRLLK